MTVQTSNGYPILEVVNTNGGKLSKILVERDHSPFGHNKRFAVAWKDMDDTGYDGWVAAISYDLTYGEALELVYQP
tara:strand:- start:1137 stop:1364 length:228 start_codon:yes stop_codon:yes gene_type:complete